MWKVGNTDEGQKAAASHTANLGGAMALYKAAFNQTGIIQIDRYPGHGGLRPHVPLWQVAQGQSHRDDHRVGRRLAF